MGQLVFLRAKMSDKGKLWHQKVWGLPEPVFGNALWRVSCATGVCSRWTKFADKCLFSRYELYPKKTTKKDIQRISPADMCALHLISGF